MSRQCIQVFVDENNEPLSSLSSSLTIKGKYSEQEDCEEICPYIPSEAGLYALIGGTIYQLETNPYLPFSMNCTVFEKSVVLACSSGVGRYYSGCYFTVDSDGYYQSNGWAPACVTIDCTSISSPYYGMKMTPLASEMQSFLWEGYVNFEPKNTYGCYDSTDEAVARCNACNAAYQSTYGSIPAAKIFRVFNTDCDVDYQQCNEALSNNMWECYSYGDECYYGCYELTDETEMNECFNNCSTIAEQAYNNCLSSLAAKYDCDGKHTECINNN